MGWYACSFSSGFGKKIFDLPKQIGFLRCLLSIHIALSDDVDYIIDSVLGFIRLIDSGKQKYFGQNIYEQSTYVARIRRMVK